MVLATAYASNYIVTGDRNGQDIQNRGINIKHCVFGLYVSSAAIISIRINKIMTQ
jgi:hypothetical protein